MSNSKLNPSQKYELKSLRRLAALAHISVFAFSNGVTIAIREFPENPEAHTLRFTASIASAEEKKLRRKVGEFYALQAMQDGRGEPVTQDGPESLDQIARRIAESLGSDAGFVTLEWESAYLNL